MFFSLFLAAVVGQDPQADFDAEARVREAIAVVRPVAYRSGQVDWDSLEAEMLTQAQGARDTADLLPAYQTLVSGLEDGHSFLQPPASVVTVWQERHGDRDFRTNPAPQRQITSTFYSRSEVEHRDLESRDGRSIRLVVVPAFAGNARGERAETYADAVFAAVADTPYATCGYILDLRGNVGGNFWPMVTGLSGLLGDGPQGLFRDAHGLDSAYARLESGQALIAEGENAGMVMARAPGWRDMPGLSAMPVAILVDDATASSGEGVALAFVGRPATRSFGIPTYGVASANDGFTLSDGVNLVITVAMMVDPLGRTHPDGYTPDAVMEASADLPVEAAQLWLSTLPQCGD